MTVCVAALCQWLYPSGEEGPCVIIASDRMMTSGNTEYEPPKRKIGFLGKSALIMAAGDFTIHSEVLNNAISIIDSSEVSKIADIAEIYAKCLRELKSKRAVEMYLSPFGWDLNGFIAAQSRLNVELACSIFGQIQNFEIDATAIIAGCDERGRIYIVDQDGIVSSQEEIGFAAIGLGYSHAKSQFMLAEYASWWPCGHTTTLTYAAKKAAEVAPGVGSATDMAVIRREGIEYLDVELMNLLQIAYEGYRNLQRDFVRSATAQISDHFRKGGDRGIANANPTTEVTQDDREIEVLAAADSSSPEQGGKITSTGGIDAGSRSTATNVSGT